MPPYRVLAARQRLGTTTHGSRRRPCEDGDVDTALDAWRRGRALLALARLQAEARRTGTVALTARQVAGDVRAVRRARRARESDR
jgi:hypothetical protein